MYKKAIILLLVFILALTACNSTPPESSPEPPAPSGSEPAGSSSYPDGSMPTNVVPDGKPVYTGKAPNEDTDYSPWETKGAFTPPGPQETTVKTSYLICEGQPMEAEVVVLTAAEPGPTIYIIASVHGNEVAAYSAADRLKDMELKSGTLYILSPANVQGKENYSRFVTEDQDLNRSFPGNPEGTQAEQLAHAIMEDVKRAEPAFIFDLHEAITSMENRDFLGSSLIYTDLSDMSDLFLDMYLATQDGELCSEPFNFFGPGPVGSVNNVLTTELKTPVITVETYRVYALERRIEDQLAIVGYTLRHFGLVA